MSANNHTHTTPSGIPFGVQQEVHGTTTAGFGVDSSAVHHKTHESSFANANQETPYGHNTRDQGFSNTDSITPHHVTGTTGTATTAFQERSVDTGHHHTTTDNDYNQTSTARSGSVGSIGGPLPESNIEPKSGVGSANAPGKTGVVGENVLAGLGVGGSKVERPVEDQGIAEKIVSFFGA